jgi:L-alanine-DL-glutamate epimerase-like enolase superfamily enzyme
MSASLRITGVERITLDVPFTPRCAQWNALLVWNWCVVEIIRLRTNAREITGYGETLPHYTWGRVSDDAIARVKGKNPAELLGDDRLGAGLQMAIYDAVGKSLGVPVYRLLNLPKVREWCPLAWWNTKMPPEALAEEAKEALAAGYTAHKFKARPFIDVLQQVEAISAVTPANYRLDIDWNEMLLNAETAAPVLQSLENNPRVAIFEGPIPQRDVDGYVQLRRQTNRPLAIHFGEPDFATCVRADMCDGFVVKGGVAEVLRAGTLSAAFEKKFWLQLVGTGLVTAMAAHFGAVLSHAQWPAITCMNNYSDDLLTEPLQIRDGCVRVPEAPGLGVRVDEQALERCRMGPPYAHPERRHIISIVWPNGRRVHYAHMHAQISNCTADYRAQHGAADEGFPLT